MIRRIIQLAALLSLGIFIGSLSAQQSTGAVNLFCQDGNVKASTQGAPSTNTLQGSYPKCTVTVYLTGTTTHATIYKDSSSTPLANPFTANADGSFVFFAASKAGYDVVTSAGIPITFPQAFTYTDIWIANDGGGGGGGTCGPLSGDATSTNCGNGNFVSSAGTNNQAYGYQNFVNNVASNSIGAGSQNLNNVSGTGGENPDNLIGIGLGSVSNVTDGGGGAQTNAVIGIGFAASRNTAGADIIGIGDDVTNNLISTAVTCYSEYDIGIGAQALSNNVGGIAGGLATRNVIAIGQTVASGLGLDNTAPCTSGNQPSSLIAIGQGALWMSFIPFVGGPVMAPQSVVAIGANIAENYGGQSLVTLGALSGENYLAGSVNNIAIGASTGDGPYNEGAGGHGEPLNAVNHMIAMGDHSSYINTGSEVISIGDHTLACVTNCQFVMPNVGSGNTGNELIVIGDHALPANTSGTHNVAIGYYAGGNGYVQGSNNPVTVGNSNQTGSQNTWIGDNSGPTSTTQLSNTIALGYNAFVTASNQTAIGNSSITSLTIFGTGDGCLSSTSGVITGSGSACGSGGGGGSNVEVNGGGTLATVNLSSTTPAAPANGINVTWATPSGINVSAAIVGDGNVTHFLNGTGTFTTPSGGSGTVTSIATTGPIGGGTITTTGTITCTTCVVASTPGVGIAHFAGSTQTVTSSAVNLAGADVTGLLPHANIAATAVTPGSYTNANITVAADGSITAAANGSSGGSVAFSGVTAGTNAAALVMGTGGSLTTSGSGSINATLLGGVALSGLCQTGGTGCPQLAVTKAAVSHQFFTSYTSSTGVFTAAQPAFTDISGQATLAQLPNGSANSVLLGYGAAGSGSPPVQITLGTNLSMSGTTLNATGGGSGLPCSGTCTAGTMGLFGASGTSITNSHLDETTNAGEDTFSQPVVVTGAPGIIFAHATATPGVAGSVVYTVDATSGFAEMNQNNLGLERIAGWNTANIFTANQTAPSFIASGTNAGSMVLTNGTAPGAVSSSVQLIAPATVTTGYNFVMPAGAPGVAGNAVFQCSGTSAATCSFAAGGSVGYLTAASPYGGFSINNNFAPSSFIGAFGDTTGSDPNLYLNAATGGQINEKIANVTVLTIVSGSSPTGGCAGNFLVFSVADGKGTWCNGSTYVGKF